MDFLIWVAIFFVGSLALRVPAVQVAVGWLFAAVLGPPILLFAGKMPTRPVFRPVPGESGTAATAGQDAAATTSKSIPPMVESQLTRRSDELVALGFQLCGTWQSERTAIKTDTVARVLTHEASRTVATIFLTMTAPGRTTINLSVGSFDPPQANGTPGNWRWTCCGSSAQSKHSLTQGTALLPSFQAPRLLLQAHTALAGTVATSPGMEMPRSNEQWPEFLTTAMWSSFQPLFKNGTMRLHRDGTARPTIRGAFRLTFGALWPLQQRRQRAALAAERALLESCGLLPLLEQALAHQLPDAQAKAIETATAITLTPDDRGNPAAILPPPERVRQAANDPAVSALLRLATQNPNPLSLSLSRGQVIRILSGLVVFFAILGWLSTMRSTWPAVMFTVSSIVALFSWEVFKNARAQIRMPSDELKREPGRAKLLARGVCPSCLYRLSGLRTEADGCLVCPECGAAWRRDRVREFLPPAAEQPDALPMQTPARGHSGDTTRDSRLNPVLCATPTLRAERAIASSEVATRLDRIIPRLTATGRRRRVILTVVFLLFMAPALLTVVLLNRWSYSSIFIALLGSLGLIGVARAILGGSVGRPPAFIIKTLLAESLCPSCVLPLEGRQPQADGCTVCSCGAAWKLEPSASAQPV